MSKKDFRKVIRAALKRGWIDVSDTGKRGHYRIRYWDGTCLTCPGSPGDDRGLRNFTADVRRVERLALDTDAKKAYGYGRRRHGKKPTKRKPRSGV